MDKVRAAIASPITALAIACSTCATQMAEIDGDMAISNALIAITAKAMRQQAARPGKWRKSGRSGIVETMQQSAPIAQDLVLVSGGHAHVHVLKRFGMRPAPGVRLTLITRDIETPYSGMLPGYVAGLYSFAECHIDLLRLARFAGARLIHDEAIGLDRTGRQVLCDAHPPIRYPLALLHDKPAARAFRDYLRGPAAREAFVRAGFGVAP